MALIKCQECGHEVSDTCDKCPNCGASISSQQLSVGDKNMIVKICCFGAAIFFGIFGITSIIEFFEHINDDYLWNCFSTSTKIMEWFSFIVFGIGGTLLALFLVMCALGYDASSTEEESELDNGEKEE